jgi:catalase
MTNRLLFVRPEPGSGKEQEAALGSCARGLAKSLMCGSLLLACAAATADNTPVPTQIVDLANKVDGVHPGYRAFHAKGVVVEGSFKATAEAARLSRAALFNGSTIRVTARFSDGSGMPTVPDGSPAMPRGIAIKYHLPGGVDTDMVTNSFKFFPVGTGEDFRDLLQAIVASPPDAPHPTKLEQFFGSHPNAPKAIGSLPIPDSFADEEYHGIDAFIFVNKSGQRQAVRYVIAPEEVVHITPEEAAKLSPNYLFDDLAKRVAQKPLVFHVKAQLAEPGDQTKDASQPWPDDRKLVDLGVLTLTKVVPNSAQVEKKLLFVPTNLTPGIELSDDPLPSVRAAAYGVSFGRRSQ